MGRGDAKDDIHQGLLVVRDLVVLAVDEEDGVLSSRIVAGEDLPEIDVLNDAHAVD